jgi:spore coat protein CotH
MAARTHTIKEGRGLFVLFTAIALLSAAYDSNAAAPTTAPTSAAEFFDPTHAHTIHIRMSAERWKLLEPGAASRYVQTQQAAKKKGPPPTDLAALADDISIRQGSAAYAFVKGDVELDVQSLADVGIRLKGHFSYSVSQSSPRRPMRFDFDRFVENQRFAGVASVNLNNHAVDPSQARETLAYELFRELDVPAPRTGYALVYVTVPGLYDNEYLGLYTLIEEIDSKFVKKHFGNSNGMLFKPSGMRGLAYFGDAWPPYESRYLPKSAVDDNLAKRMIELARLINRADDATFKQNIASYLDADELLRYVAVSGALANFDSFTSTGHNYYLYANPADGRIAIIPWDLNMTFGGYSWVGTDSQIENMSIMHPYVDNNYLIERLLTIDIYRNAYREHVRKLAEKFMSAETIKRRLASIAPVFAQADQAARQAGKIGSPTTRPATYPGLRQPDLMSYVENRAKSMQLQLEGKERGYIPVFRDPETVPREWAKVVLPAAALMDAIDANADGRLDEAEITAAINQLLETAEAPPNGSLDLPTATRALDQIMTDEMRRCASAEAWAKWLFHIADSNHDGKITAAKILAAWKRLLASADRDYDGMMGGRELVETLSGTGPP